MRADANHFHLMEARLVREDQRSDGLRSGLGLLPPPLRKNSLNKVSCKNRTLSLPSSSAGMSGSASFTTPTLPFE